jgi:hypothetical protein
VLFPDLPAPQANGPVAPEQTLEPKHRRARTSSSPL